MSFSGGPEDPYIEEIFADLDAGAIELAELAAESLREAGWAEAVLFDNEGPKIWVWKRGDQRGTRT